MAKYIICLVNLLHGTSKSAFLRKTDVIEENILSTELD